jgi:hypothetical protein
MTGETIEWHCGRLKRRDQQKRDVETTKQNVEPPRTCQHTGLFGHGVEALTYAPLT